MTDRDIARAVSHPGRIRMGVTICASSTAASTDLVPTGRTTAAQILRATSNAIDNSTDPVTPSARTTSTSSGVLSSITSSPGRSVTVGVKGGAGRDVRRRCCAADPSSPWPSASACTSRLNVVTGGTSTAPGPWVSSRTHPTMRRSRLSVPLERSRCASST